LPSADVNSISDSPHDEELDLTIVEDQVAAEKIQATESQSYGQVHTIDATDNNPNKEQNKMVTCQNQNGIFLFFDYLIKS
jgi:hypothetical protein